MVNGNEILAKLAEMDAGEFERLKGELALFRLLGIEPDDLLALKEMIALWPYVKEALLRSSADEAKPAAPVATSTYEHIKTAAGLDQPAQSIRFDRGDRR